MLATSRLDYDLPPDRIAVRPAEPRDTSRLMVISRSRPDMCEHRRFSDLPSFLRRGDLLVFNSSGVLPARLQGRRADTGGSISGLFLREEPHGRWMVLLQSGGRLRPGMVIDLHAPQGEPTPARLELVEKVADAWLAMPVFSDGRLLDTAEALAMVGATPLPPYILKARRETGIAVGDAADRDWYRTVYADAAHALSVAAPTAGLHFTPDLLAQRQAMGVEGAEVRLHVGAGTFKPVQTEFVEDHPIHAERLEIPPACVQALEAAGARGGRVIAVGTTSVRAIESLPRPPQPEMLHEGFEGETRLLITPGFAFRWTDALVTNFHLPRSTLLAMVSAMLPEGPERLMDHYRVAVSQGYRFYSYGDAMLILP